MSKSAVAITIFDAALAVAIDASGFGGTLTAISAWVIVGGMLVFLVSSWRSSRRLLPDLHEFIIRRRLGAPPNGDSRSCEYALDTVIAYEQAFAEAVGRRVRKLQSHHLIGPYEARDLNSPGNLDEIAHVWERLTELDRTTHD
jgi:hypothetical protein